MNEIKFPTVKEMKLNRQYVLLEFNNSCPSVVQMISSEKITLEKVVEYFEENEGFNEDRDSITFIDKPSKIKI